MIKSALIETVKTFTRQEVKELTLFINSPFFNTNQSVIKLYEQIKILYPLFEEKLLNKNLLFEKSFGKIKYDDSFMRMTVFRLMELIKEFLIHKNLQRNYLINESLLLDELSNRELNNLMMKTIYDLDKKIGKQKAKEAEVYLANYRLEYFKNEAKARDTKMITYKDTLNIDLMNEQKSLNTFFFISSLKFFQYFLNQKDFVVNTDGFPDFINNILEYLKLNNEYLSVPVLNVYYHLVLMLITKDDKHFFELKKILFENKDDISHIEKFNLIAVLRNYAQRRNGEGKIEFGPYMFELLKFSIEKDILTPSPGGKYMSELRFMNITWSGLQAKEFDWLEDFINKYIEKIEPDKRQYVFAYNTAALNFEKGKFSEALEKLGNSGPIKNVIYKAAIKQLNTMIFYELRWLDSAAELSDAYKHFIKSDKLLPELYKTKSNSFIKYFNKLLKIKESNDKNLFELSELISELKSTSMTWLLKKAQELQDSKL